MHLDNMSLKRMRLIVGRQRRMTPTRDPNREAVRRARS